VRHIFLRVWQRTRDLWDRARREHSSPREIGWSLALGVFCGCTPFVGLHMWLALGGASLLRLNRLWAFLGSRVSTGLLFAWIAFCEIELAHRLRAGAWMALDPSAIAAQRAELFGDWFVGTPLVGFPAATLVGLVAYGLAHRARSRALTPRTPDAPPPPSSGSPRSAPPAPSS
jgi:uncharacterized protein (DUF2062 family)